MPIRFKDEARFRNVDYKHTDLRKTFARVRREQEADRRLAEQRDDAAVTRLHVVFPNLRKQQA